MRDRMDAWRVRRATDHRQYVIPQALFRLPRSLQHHPRERIAHVDRDEGRMAPADRPFRFRNGPQRLPLGLSAGRANRHGLSDRVGDEPAMQWRVTVEGPRCRFLVFGHLVLGEQEFGPAGRIEIELEAKALHFQAGSQRSLGPAISRGCLSPGDEHAGAGRSHRRRRTSVRSTASAAAADTSRSARSRRTNSCSRSWAR